MNLWKLDGVKSWAVAAAGVTMMAIATPTLAQEENPWKQGNYWDVSGIHIKDGGGLKYAQFLASSWVKNQEFAKSQGWISSYMVLSNEYPRQGEPDLYLITVFTSMASPDEQDKRTQAWREFNKKTMSQMQAESGARADYRTVGGQMLLRELVLRK
jgi:hypothetical protein